MRVLVIGVAVIAGLVLVVVLIGLTRPKGHAARTQARLSHSPAEVWATISDFERWSEWNPGVKRVDILSSEGPPRSLNVVGSWGEARTVVSVWDPPQRMVTDMDAGSFRGRWTYELTAAADGGTALTVTEEGEVDNPVFRAMMIFHDNYATMMGFHRALGARLGETVVPSKVELTRAP